MPDIEKVSVALTAEQVAQLKVAVDSGEYATTSEAVRDALRAWQLRRDLHNAEITRLRALWDEGKASGISKLTSEENLAEARRKAKSRAGKAV